MDGRTHEHAAVLVDWSVRIEIGDDVVVSIGEEAHDPAVAVADALGECGVNVVMTYASEEVQRAHLRAYDGDLEPPEYELALYEVANSVLFLGDTRNTVATADVPTKTQQAYGRATSEVKEVRMDIDWISTAHPTRAMAQRAGMSFEAYADFVYDATLRDWSELAEETANTKDALDAGSEVCTVKTDTDLTMSIEGRTAINPAVSVACDSHNPPSGGAFTAPVEDAIEGEVLFDVPMTLEGQRVENVHLAFEGGEVVDFPAGAGEDVLAGILDTDGGVRRLGELGIGMNRGIDRFTDSIFLDEKTGDIVHLAVGRACGACLLEGEDGNQSTIHTGMITDMSEDSRTGADGEVVQRNGTFRWEDGF